MVRQRGRGYGNRAPPPAGQFDQYMIAPTGPSPEDRWQLLAEERVCRIGNGDLIGEAVHLRGRIRGWVSSIQWDSGTRSPVIPNRSQICTCRRSFQARMRQPLLPPASASTRR